MSNKLNDQNPEYMIWHYEELEIVLLGGIRIEGLHTMRVTMKVSYKTYPSLRHTIDLYNDHQTTNWTKKIAERYTLNNNFVINAFIALTDTLELYRLNKLEDKSKQTQQQTISEADKAAAIQFLKTPNLLERTNELIGQAGVIGEELNRLIMYLVFTSRKTNRPLHIISMGSSGTGKSHLQEKVAELIPQDEKIEITSITSNAFYYYDSDALAHKLILIEDYDGVITALYPIRELQSKQRIGKTITVKDKSGNTKTLQLLVYGPVCIAGCTTQESIYEDNANRSFLIYLDESKAQDERIMQYQRLLSAGKVDSSEQKNVQQFLQNVQRMLQPISVRNPFAEQLILPPEIFKPRRTNAHYIAFIEAITYYKQYQRTQLTDKATGEMYIETTLEDITEAGTLMKEILLKKSDELGYATRTYLERLKQYLNERKNNMELTEQTRNSPEFSNKEIRAALKENPNNQKKYMFHLQQYGYIQKASGDQKKGYLYIITSYEEYYQLQHRIRNAMDEVISKLTTKEQQNSKAKGIKQAPK
jgi:hypothetical protein